MLTRGELIDLLQRTSWTDDGGRTKQADFILESFEVVPLGTTVALDVLQAEKAAQQEAKKEPLPKK